MVDTLGFRTKADLVHEELRARLLRGDLQPGDRVPIATVARELGVSQIPVREGVKRLEAEGLLVFETHKGAVVPHLAAADIEETFAIRAELEGLAVRRAAGTITPERLAELRELLDAMADAAARGDAHAYGRGNRAFHLTIYRSQPYARLASMIEVLWDQTDWCRRIFARDEESLTASAAEHEAILAALARRDGAAAEAHLHEQKRRSSAWLLDHLDTEESTT
jgi:DNA-binding GntR family transcriptional regulator